MRSLLMVRFERNCVNKTVYTHLVGSVLLLLVIGHGEVFTYDNSLKTKIQFVPRGKTCQLMLYREIIAVCSHTHTKHTNTLCGQNVNLLNLTAGTTRVFHRPLICYILTTNITGWWNMTLCDRGNLRTFRNNLLSSGSWFENKTARWSEGRKIRKEYQALWAREQTTGSPKAVLSLLYQLTLRMQRAGSSEASISFYQPVLWQ